MMKFKTTKRAMKENYYKIVKISYCNAQHLLHFESPIAYSTRAEGWACDYYDVDDVLISTGYAPIDSKRTHPNYQIIKKYDNAAEKIISNYSIPLKEQEKQVKALLSEFMKEVL